MITNTGSLGMGISKAKGMAFADQLAGRDRRIFVMTGDGELQEGQIWESLASAVNYKLDNITVIVDHNKLQSDIWVKDTSDLGNLEAKFAAFGWYVDTLRRPRSRSPRDDARRRPMRSTASRKSSSPIP